MPENRRRLLVARAVRAGGQGLIRLGTILFARGQRKIYRGKELETIGMPCGGIGAGQLYVRGDGTLAQWWIDNTYYDTGYGQPGVTTTRIGSYPIGYANKANRPPSPVDQGFAIAVKSPGGPAVVRRLSRDDFDDIGFIGEYPIATILYGTKDGAALPVEIRGEVSRRGFRLTLGIRPTRRPSCVTSCGTRPVNRSRWLLAAGSRTSSGWDARASRPCSGGIECCDARDLWESSWT